MDFTKLKIGDKVLYKAKTSQNGFAECKIVYIFKAYKIPKKKKVIKYYGKGIISPRYGRVFGPLKINRFVLKRGKKDYIVLPIGPETFRYAEIKFEDDYYD